MLDHPKIEEIAKKHGKATGHVLLRFQIQRGVIVLTKSVNPDRIKERFQFTVISKRENGFFGNIFFEILKVQF